MILKNIYKSSVVINAFVSDEMFCLWSCGQVLVFDMFVKFHSYLRETPSGY